MQEANFHTDVDGELADSVVSAVRTSVGDTLRSVVYFTPSEYDVLYVRQGLYDSVEDARAAKSNLVDFETVGFAEAPTRTRMAVEDEGTGIGPYAFTVRFHEDGFVARVLVGDSGVILTADAMDVTAFEDAAAAIRRLLDDQ